MHVFPHTVSVDIVFFEDFGGTMFFKIKEASINENLGTYKNKKYRHKPVRRLVGQVAVNFCRLPVSSVLSTCGCLAFQPRAPARAIVLRLHPPVCGARIYLTGRDYHLGDLRMANTRRVVPDGSLAGREILIGIYRSFLGSKEFRLQWASGTFRSAGCNNASERS